MSLRLRLQSFSVWMCLMLREVEESFTSSCHRCSLRGRTSLRCTRSVGGSRESGAGRLPHSGLHQRPQWENEIRGWPGTWQLSPPFCLYPSFFHIASLFREPFELWTNSVAWHLAVPMYERRCWSPFDCTTPNGGRKPGWRCLGWGAFLWMSFILPGLVNYCSSWKLWCVVLCSSSLKTQTGGVSLNWTWLSPFYPEVRKCKPLHPQDRTFGFLPPKDVCRQADVHGSSAFITDESLLKDSTDI